MTSQVTKLLLPHRFQKIGWWMIIPFSILLILNTYFDFSPKILNFKFETGKLFDFLGENFTDEIALIGIFISLFFIAFSKEKHEDEYIQKLRLDSLLIACYFNTFILILGTIFFYGFAYLEFMGYNMFTIQVIFVIRFRWILWQQNKFVNLAEG